jgi:hypothetical protein
MEQRPILRMTWHKYIYTKLNTLIHEDSKDRPSLSIILKTLTFHPFNFDCQIDASAMRFRMLAFA